MTSRVGYNKKSLEFYDWPMQVRINFVDFYRYIGVESPHNAMANNFMKSSTTTVLENI